MDIQEIVRTACKLGAKGFQVLGWEPPHSGSDNPDGRLISIVPLPPSSASEVCWYDK
jgi:hypothetical protein